MEDCVKRSKINLRKEFIHNGDNVEIEQRLLTVKERHLHECGVEDVRMDEDVFDALHTQEEIDLRDEAAKKAKQDEIDAWNKRKKELKDGEEIEEMPEEFKAPLESLKVAKLIRKGAIKYKKLNYECDVNLIKMSVTPIEGYKGYIKVNGEQLPEDEIFEYIESLHNKDFLELYANAYILLYPSKEVIEEVK